MSEIIVRFDLRFSRRVLRGALAAVMLLCAASELDSESVTLTTYYPAPSGVYTKLITTYDTYLARDGGNVGVGTMTPGVKLDVVGTFRASGASDASCVAGTAGILRYSAVAGQMQFCNGAAWLNVRPQYVGRTASAYNGATVGGYTGGDVKCNTDFPGARMCSSADFSNGRPSATGWYSTFNLDLHPASGNQDHDDCIGWTSNLSSVWGTSWNGSAPTQVACNASGRILCCR